MTVSPLYSRRVPATVLIVLVLAACGPSGDGPLTKEDLIAEADAICADIDEKVDSLETPRTPEDLEASIEELRAITDEGIRDLRALRPPPEDEDQFSRMLDKIEDAIGMLPALAEAGKANDVDELQRLGRAVQEAANEASEIAQDYGFERCGGESVQPAAD